MTIQLARRSRSPDSRPVTLLVHQSQDKLVLRSVEAADVWVKLVSVADLVVFHMVEHPNKAQAAGLVSAMK